MKHVMHSELQQTVLGHGMHSLICFQVTEPIKECQAVNLLIIIESINNLMIPLTFSAGSSFTTVERFMLTFRSSPFALPKEN